MANDLHLRGKLCSKGLLLPVDLLADERACAGADSGADQGAARLSVRVRGAKDRTRDGARNRALTGAVLIWCIWIEIGGVHTGVERDKGNGRKKQRGLGHDYLVFIDPGFSPGGCHHMRLRPADMQ